mgnify:CR=1 FL=1
MLVRDMPGCLGCPHRGTGNQPFVPDEVFPGAPVLAVFQNPGAEEEAQGRPLVGPTGQMMERTFFPLAGLQRGEVSLANTLRCRWRGGNQLPDLKDKGLQAAIAHCTQAHHRLPEGAMTILASGEYAVHAMTGCPKPFSDRAGQPSGWRGFVLPYSPGAWRHPVSVWTPGPRDIPVLATYHLALLFRQPLNQVAMKRDWSKVWSLVGRTWPVKFPPIRTEPPDPWPALSAFDTEFHRSDPSQLTRYSMATSGAVYVVEARDAGPVAVAPGSVVVAHNASVDVPHVARILPVGDIQIEDTMLMDAVLWSGFPHDLNSLGSLYGRTNRHKHLAEANPIQYSGGDALHTLDTWHALSAQFTRDPQSKWVYDHCQRPLLPILLRAKQTGSRVDQNRVQVALKAMHSQQADVTKRAQAALGWPVNVGSSKQVSDWLFKVEGVR